MLTFPGGPRVRKNEIYVVSKRSEVRFSRQRLSVQAIVTRRGYPDVVIPGITEVTA